MQVAAVLQLGAILVVAVRPILLQAASKKLVACSFGLTLKSGNRLFPFRI